MNVESLIALLVFLFPLAYSPGPGNAFFAAIGASKGLRAAVPALAGYHLATFVVTAILGAGIGAAFVSHPAVTKLLAAVGSLYVAWLAWSFIRPAQRSGCASRGSAVEPRIGFWAGALVLLLNPKAYYIVAVLFTQFLSPSQSDDVFSVVVITAIFTLNNLIAFIVWAVAGRMLFMMFRGERVGRALDYAFAVLLGGVAVWMALPIIAG